MISKEPFDSIKEGKDPITGNRLVYYSKTGKRWIANPNIPKVRSGEEESVENYYEAKKNNFIGWRLHHRLELTLDNKEALSMMDLINFGMYYHRPYFELIWLRENEHNSLHAFTRVSEKCPMFGRRMENHPGWKGDSASIQSKYKRGLKLFRAGKISEDELQILRNMWIEYKKMRKLK